MMMLRRSEAAEAIGVSVWTLARASADAAFGEAMESAGLLPRDVGQHGSPRYRIADVERVIETRQDPDIMPRLRAACRKIK